MCLEYNCLMIGYGVKRHFQQYFSYIVAITVFDVDYN
jgi:hypothetical protein